MRIADLDQPPDAESLAIAWDGDPTPLLTRSPTRPFPVDALPDRLGAYVDALAEATQTPTDLAGCCTLGTLAACCGGRAVVEARPGWREPTNLYLLPVMPPGTRKSAVLAAATRPLYEVEKMLVETKRAGIAEAITLKAIAEKAADQARAKAARASGEQRVTLNAEAVDADATAASIHIPATPRLIADDVTPEAAASLLAQHAGKLAIMSAEGGIFDIIAGRYSGGIPQLDVWLKAHAGDPLRVDRKGRPAEHIPAPALTMLLCAQPAVLEAIAAHRTFHGRGLLARILYALPPDNVGTRSIGAPPVPGDVATNYEQTIQRLAETMYDWTDPAVLTLTADGAECLLKIEHHLEPQLAVDGALGAVREWASKLAGAILRIAGCLHLAQHPDDGVRLSITADTLTAAWRLGDYFADHALAAFDRMGQDPRVTVAERILTHLRRRGSGTFSRRDLSRAHLARTPDTLDAALDLLADFGWIAEQPTTRKPGPGRPASPTYSTHPKVFA